MLPVFCPVQGFQSTLPRGSDRPGLTPAPCAPYFNPRSLAGATLRVIGMPEQIAISIHAPSRERPLSGCTSLPLVLFQSTLPRGSDLGIFFVILYDKISIHAPSRERLCLPFTFQTSIGISIHAPSRERLQAIGKEPFWKEISIHAPSRERHRVWLQCLRTAGISIHAPSRERLTSAYSGTYNSDFNPRSLAGATY